MPLERRTLKNAEEVSLLSAVRNRCPLCDASLFYEKHGKSFKHYEIAHIYPLNPLPLEVSLLASEERLSADPNHIDNLIPLCLACHGKFDKPRTVEEYREVVNAKKATLSDAERRELHFRYGVLADIKSVIDALDNIDSDTHVTALVLDAKALEEKFNATMPSTARRKIRYLVNEYFFFVRQSLQRLDLGNPGSASVILSQVRTFYLVQKSLGWTQQQIFVSVVDWLVKKTNPKSFETAEILAAFFVQNCEVFE